MGILRTFARAALVLVVGCAMVSGLTVIGGHAQHSNVIVFLTTNGTGFNALSILDVDRYRRINWEFLRPYHNLVPLWTPHRTDVIFMAADNTLNYGIYRSTMGQEEELPIFLTSEPGQGLSVGRSPDGENIGFAVTTRETSTLYLMDSLGEHRRYILDLEQGAHHLIWSPDGRYLLVETHDSPDSRISIVDISQQTLQFIEYGLNASWSPDGQNILYRARNVKLYVYNLTSHTHTRLTDEQVYETPTWSPDGQKIAYISRDQQLTIISAESGELRERHSLSNLSGFGDLFWLPDGNRLIFDANERIDGCGDFNLYMIDTDGSNLRRLLDVVIGTP